jgi:hypothetical protein
MSFVKSCEAGLRIYGFVRAPIAGLIIGYLTYSCVIVVSPYRSSTSLGLLMNCLLASLYDCKHTGMLP